jgi:non-ribosomal peptide synthetase component F
MVLLAIFKILLQQRTEREDISVGSPVAGRRTSEVEGLIGNFVNTLVLRTNVVPSLTFRDLLTRVKETALGAYSHQEIPYEQVAAALHDRRNHRARLFEVWFVLHNTPAPALKLPGLRAEAVQIQGTVPRHDLSLSLWPSWSGLEAALDYRADLFSQSEIRQMAEDFKTLAHAVAQGADRSCVDLAGLLGRSRREHRDHRKQAARLAGLETLRAKRRPEGRVGKEREG